MTKRSAAAIAVAFIVLLISSFINPIEAGAGDVPAPFSYAWKIVFRTKEIGWALSRFTFSKQDGHIFLTETGKREFLLTLGPVSIDFSERTDVCWDEAGLMKNYRSRVTINGSINERRGEREPDGTVVWEKIEGEKTKRVVFTPDEFDYTDCDRFFENVVSNPGEEGLEILMMSRGKLRRMTYRFAGWESLLVGGEEIRVRKIEMAGFGVDGSFLIDDLGIPVMFVMKTIFGDFSFIPVAPGSLPEGFARDDGGENRWK